MSVLFIPAAATFTSTSPGPGEGTATSSRTSSRSNPPCAVSNTARMVRGVTVFTSPQLSRHGPCRVRSPDGMLVEMTETLDHHSDHRRVRSRAPRRARTSNGLDPCELLVAARGSSIAGTARPTSHAWRAGRVGTRTRRADARTSGDPGHPDFPEILEQDGAKGGRNARWHTDVTFVATPPAASVLVNDVTPDVGRRHDVRRHSHRLRATCRAVAEVVRRARGSASHLAARVLGRAVRLGARLGPTRNSYSTMRRRFRR